VRAGHRFKKLPGGARDPDSSKLADVFGIDFGAADPKTSDEAIGKKRKSVAPLRAKAANRVGNKPVRGESGDRR
jgi:hypothetical protein